MRCCAIGFVVLVTACGIDNASTIDVPSADPKVFETTVYPILLRDCGFNGCHGTHERFFSVFGPGRARLDPNTLIYDPATPYELALSYSRARSMLVDAEGSRHSLLVRKPIPTSQGGAGHKGDDPWGRSVYASTSDPDYLEIYAWATKSAP